MTPVVDKDRRRNVTMRFASKAAATAVLAITAAVGAQNCADQREPECITGFTVERAPGLERVGYATRLEQLSQSGTCNDGELLKGGIFGIRTYYQPGSDGLLDYSIPGKVALQLEDVGLAAFTAASRAGFNRLDPNLTLYNFGTFATATPVNNLCDVVNIAPVDVNFPGAEAVEDDPETEDEDESLPAIDPVHFRVEWSRLQFYVTTPYPGNQFEGEVTIQVNDCVGTYKATGVYGTDHVDCAKLDEDGNPTNEPDPSRCQALADPDANVFFGTGINPDFPVACDQETLLCLLQGNFPAINQ